MSSYIDIHSHILPAIDDGPVTLNEAVDLARAYVSAGFSTVIATPHATEGSPAPALIKESLCQLKEELKQQKIPLTVLPGSEYHIEPKILERLHSGEILTLNSSRYLLLELPFFQPLPPYTLPLLDNLVTAGYIPVIPHPERALALQRNPQLFFDLQEAGALFQTTWGALNGKLGSASLHVVNMMLEANLAHLFATDAHGPDTNLLQLEEPLAILNEKKGEDFVSDLLTGRPAQLIDNQPLELPPVSESSAPTGRAGYMTPPRPTIISRLRRRIGH